MGDFTSPVGRTRTLPAEDATVSRLALAVANCQWYEAGTYAAYRHMAEEDVDLVVHLGDYIYESTPGHWPRVGPADRDRDPGRLPAALRLPTRSTPTCRPPTTASRSCATWDDHEVANNYLGDSVPEGDDPRSSSSPSGRPRPTRRGGRTCPAAYRPPDSDHADIYRELTFGDLARLEMLDERQYADVAPCRDEAADDFGDCAARTGEDRTRLGSDQEAWFAETIGQGGVTWDLIGNPVVLAGIDAGHRRQSEFYLDTWDGYPDAQRRFIAAMAEPTTPSCSPATTTPAWCWT